MFKNNPSNVSAAFEIVLEEIEAEVDLVNKVGAKAFEGSDYKSIGEVLERANQITAFRDKVVTLRKEWDTLSKHFKVNENEKIIHAERRNMGRLQRGQRTPQTAYYQPILRVLKEYGGSAKMGDVLVKLEPLMKEMFTQVDYEILASDPQMPRWRKAAQWARYDMTKEGLMNSHAERGIWEITEAGRKYLAEEIP